MKIGAQLYTVRDYCKTTADFAETLKKVAEMGYTAVQVSGTCEYEGEWLRDELKKSGLVCPVTHSAFEPMLSDTKGVCEKHKTFGCKNIGLGMVPGGKLDDGIYEEFAKKVRTAIDGFAPYGCKFAYHNHHVEFQRDAEGRLFLDRLLSDFKPAELGIIFDTYWAQFSGADPAEWLGKLKGRADCIHFKDLCIVEKTQRMAPVGSGNLNFDRIIGAAEDVGVQYAFVEQDNCYEENPFDCLKKSYDYLKSKGLN